MKKFLLLFVLAFAAILCSCTTTDAGTTYVSVKVNDSEVGLLLDENGVVTDVIDGEDDEALEGLPVDDATEKIVDEQTDPEGENDVVIDVIDDEEDEDEEAALLAKLKAKLEEYLSEKGCHYQITSETISKYIDEALTWDASFKKTKLILIALDENPELEVETLLEMSMKDLLKTIRENKVDNATYNKTDKEEYAAKVAELKEKYQEVINLHNQIAKINHELKDDTLTDEEKATLETELATLEEKYDETLYNEYKAALKALKPIKTGKHNHDVCAKLQAEYQEVIDLHDEIEEINTKLASEGLTEEEKATLNAELIELTAKYDEAKYNEYLTKLQELLEEKEDKKTPTSKVDELKEEYQEVIDLHDQIEEINTKLASEGLTEEEKAALNAELTELTSKYDEAKYNEYLTKLAALTEEKEDCDYSNHHDDKVVPEKDDHSNHHNDKVVPEDETTDDDQDSDDTDNTDNTDTLTYEEYLEKLQALNEKYQEIIDLHEQIEEVTNKLKRHHLSTEEREELTTELSELTAKFDESLYDTYLAELDALEDSLKAVHQVGKVIDTIIHGIFGWSDHH